MKPTTIDRNLTCKRWQLTFELPSCRADGFRYTLLWRSCAQLAAATNTLGCQSAPRWRQCSCRGTNDELDERNSKSRFTSSPSPVAQLPDLGPRPLGQAHVLAGPSGPCTHDQQEASRPSTRMLAPHPTAATTPRCHHAIPFGPFDQPFPRHSSPEPNSERNPRNEPERWISREGLLEPHVGMRHVSCLISWAAPPNVMLSISPRTGASGSE